MANRWGFYARRTLAPGETNHVLNLMESMRMICCIHYIMASTDPPP